MSVEANRKTVETLWNALSAMDWETLKSCLSEDVHYEDVPPRIRAHAVARTS